MESRKLSPDYWSSIFFLLLFLPVFLNLFILFSLSYPKKSLLRLMSRSGRLRTYPFLCDSQPKSKAVQGQQIRTEHYHGTLEEAGLWLHRQGTKLLSLPPGQVAWCLEFPFGIIPGFLTLFMFSLSFTFPGPSMAPSLSFLPENQMTELMMKESVQWPPLMPGHGASTGREDASWACHGLFGPVPELQFLLFLIHFFLLTIYWMFTACLKLPWI